MIGAAEHLDKEMAVLHRTVGVVNDGLMEIDADQKHVPQLLVDLGIARSTVVKTPRVKLSAIEADAIENNPILHGEHATLFRSGTMLCAYLAQDRVDISEAVKMSGTSNVETKSWSHDAVETRGEVPERSAEESTTVHRSETK